MTGFTKPTLAVFNGKTGCYFMYDIIFKSYNWRCFVICPIGVESIRKREKGGGYGAQSESIAGSELRMAHLFIQKYMNNSLILNIQIADTYLFYSRAIFFN